MAGHDDEEDDYMNMTFDGPEFQKQPETALQRAVREKKEGAERARPKSKAELAEMAKVAREQALATALPPTNKGAKMMAKMGFVPGSTLGKSEGARVTPIEVFVKGDRGGIGVDAEKKRKLRELAEEEKAGEKRQKVEATDFRERIAKDREEKRAEGMMWSAMRTLEQMETESGEGAGGQECVNEEEKQSGNAKLSDKRRLKEINVLYRAVVAQRREQQQQRVLHKYDRIVSSSERGHFTGNWDEDNEEKLVHVADESNSEDGELDEDRELAEFQALSPAERLTQVVGELRDNHLYCFWCKFKYPDKEMFGCPGTTEDQHG
nr:g patch domain-containing protein 11 [Quercus suber]